ncbi:phage tail protein [Paenibacillus tundrae]|uniref:phage tail protein n=1 Tax=Paenibacillus tundrae TaxID=528187 RepID=UPI0030D2DF26
MPKETDRLKLPLPLGNESVTRESINGIFENIDAGVATREDLDTLREAVSQMDIPDASLTQKGKVQLSNKTDGTSEAVAATEKAVNDVRQLLFQFVSDGKAKLKETIVTGKGGTVSQAGSVPTFDELDAGIASIKVTDYDFGDSSINRVISSNTTYSVGTDSYLVLKSKNLTINAGVSFEINSPNSGLILYCEGDLIINGTIDQSEKGGWGMGDILPAPLFQLPSGFNTMAHEIGLPWGGSGGSGGRGGGSANMMVGGKGAKRRLLGGFGGGGGGGGTEVRSGSTKGSALLGGRGGGFETNKTGIIYDFQDTNRPSREIDPWEWNGNDGKYGQGGQGAVYDLGAGTRANGKGGACLGAGGGGGGGTARGAAESVSHGLAGGRTGGFVAIIVRGDVTIGSTGKILTKGGAGGAGGNATAKTYDGIIFSGGGGGGGGGAGGGAVMILHGGTYTNNGTIDTSGGLGGASGVGRDSNNTLMDQGVSGLSGSAGDIRVKQINF